MRRQWSVVSVVASLLLAFGSVAAWAQEGGAADGPPVRPGQRPFGREGGPQPGQPQGPRAPFDIDIPEVREEMQRHHQEFRAIMEQMRPILMEVQKKIRELREGGADKNAIQEALKQYAPQREQLAGQMADAFATHNENMAKIFREHRAAVAKAIAERLGQGPVRRGGPDDEGAGPGPGGEGFRPRRRPGADGGPPLPPRRPPQEPGDDGAPENF